MAKDINVIAKVNNKIITDYDLNGFINEHKISNNNLALDLLIENTIKQDAVANENIVFDIDEFKESGLKNRDEYMWLKLVNKVVKPRIILTRSEIDDTLEYTGSKIIDIRYNISEIMLSNDKADAENVINKMYLEINKNNNFEKIAGTFSEINKSKNGFIGWVNKKELNKVIYDNIKNLQVGYITKPILIGSHYLIIKLNDKVEEKIIKSNDTNKNSYILHEQKLQLAIKKYYDDLYSNALIERF